MSRRPRLMARQMMIPTALMFLGLLSGMRCSLVEIVERPDPDDAPAMARWLVASNSWGVLSTISIHLKGTPWGNVVSFSDGPVGGATGRPYFYMSGLDPTPVDLDQDSRCSLTLTEIPIGTCGDRDAENPTCARLTLSGKIVEISKGDDEAEFATRALFSKHPEMAGWPTGHDWRIFKLEIENLFLVDYYGGAKALPVEDYYKCPMLVPSWSPS